MPDNDLLKTADDFELPPLPKRPAKLSNDSSAPADKDIDSDLPPLPKQSFNKPAEPLLVKSESADDDLKLPPLPEKKAEKKPAEDDADFPPLPEKKEEPAKEPVYEEEIYPEDELDDPTDFDDYDPDAEPDAEGLVLEDLTSRGGKGRRVSAQNMRDAIKMNDLTMEIGSGPVLDDLSEEYQAPQKKAKNLTDQDMLDENEKLVLKQRLNEDLGKRPTNFNARASQNLANKLLEEKRLKIAKKGFAITILPIFMGIISAGICYTQMNWGDFQWFNYVAPFMLLGAILLLIKSKHIRMLSVSIYAVCALIYVGPGLVMFTLENSIQDGIIHILFAIGAVALNIISILILMKNEAVNIYYTTNYKKR